MSIKRLTKRNILDIILVLIWMIIIFVFSSQDGNESTEKSKIVIYIFNYIGLDLNSILGDMADLVVRKGAHMTEYFILIMLIQRTLRDKYTVNKSLVFAFLITVLYASSDEYHQTFVQGRCGQAKDVLIDSCGALIYVFIIKCKHVKKNWLKSR